ncbi:MAG: glycerol-3-phosphate ABC transporter ATP-binding protein [Candidatus Margulisiibacteriota bacterium]|nr:MAG: glycerol-3-phosphate ABC transporter ATP-binding protein [Bacteroidetes bacterium GWF2_43_11]OGH98118.1 MAG: glycerol-3-phosphate ABC transporter ATP-binding protein [Candidatus Margulisbacteria bacterium GWD2_39_127]OGI11301.1 MAG: glycerol-3-phosphate ABC transporter ATP-binding protein [Candidatus Margulisbacteria bacterium GWE2_39_32]PZM78724.1 MAG: glycerol-3-phosphate ABC transporter ATP-binding protein [Candidatus Margulisiibacteriota bacterium]HAR62135.1 glycerol-3-phosphate ABC
MARVLLENVTKKFDDNIVVHKSNLEAKDREFLVLVGPSGCGKTTTLRMIAGLEEITEGRIYIGDRDVTNVHPKDRDIAMVFQNYALYPHMTVRENMAFGLKLRKIAKKVIDERVAEASGMLGLENYLERKPKQLSGGQRQRVALGRAIVRHPQVFLMDEPLSNLDAKLRVQTRGDLKKMHARLDSTIIYVTHDQVEAMTLGNRIVIMKDGVIQQVDQPISIYDNPRNIFVGGFIGSPSMNFINGMLVKEKDIFIFDTGAVRFNLNGLGLDDKLQETIGKDVVLGVRPEDIYDENTAKSLNFTGSEHQVEVEFSELLGAETYLHICLGKEQMVVKVDPHICPQIGEKVNVVMNLKKMHLFDKVSSEVII